MILAGPAYNASATGVLQLVTAHRVATVARLPLVRSTMRCTGGGF
jgi:hypothetical protein